jgi:thiol-disulfide isomerase/thioredoxin
LQTAQPGIIAEGMALLRARLVRSSPEREARRALEDTRSAARLAEDEYRARVFRVLGEALLASGARRAAADTLALAAKVGWDAKLFRKLADLRLSLGDTAEAIDMAARVVSDPLSAPATVDSVRQVFGRAVARQWTERLDGAAGDMRDQMLARAERTTLPIGIHIADGDGKSRTLADLVNGKPTLVAFWSSFCPPSIAAMPALLANGHALRARGFNVVAISEHPLDSTTKAWLADRHFDLPVYFDRDREARLALAQWGTPNFFILDGRGRLRYRMTPLSAVGAELESVR